MTPAAILDALRTQGFTVSLVDGIRLAVSPSSLLGNSQRELLRAHKAAIVQLLSDYERITAKLLKAAMLACDRLGDGDAARQQMRADCLATPEDLRADLLEHFNGTYGISSPGEAS